MPHFTFKSIFFLSLWKQFCSNRLPSQQGNTRRIRLHSKTFQMYEIFRMAMSPNQRRKYPATSLFTLQVLIVTLAGAFRTSHLIGIFSYQQRLFLWEDAMQMLAGTSELLHNPNQSCEAELSDICVLIGSWSICSVLNESNLAEFNWREQPPHRHKGDNRPEDESSSTVISELLFRGLQKS